MVKTILNVSKLESHIKESEKLDLRSRPGEGKKLVKELRKVFWIIWTIERRANLMFLEMNYSL